MRAVVLLLLAGSAFGQDWQEVDIGTAAIPGTSVETNGAIALSGSDLDIWGSSDSFHFVYQQWNGDGLFVARIAEVSAADGWAKAGIMFRQDLTENSPNICMIVSATNGVGAQVRSAAGGETSFVRANFFPPPAWVKLVRSNQTFSAFLSAEGKVWTLIATTNLSMPSQILVGMAVSSHDDSAICRATIDHADLSPYILPPAAPVNLRARFIGPDHIDLDWTDTSSTESGFVVERLGPGVEFVLIATVGPNHTHFADFVPAQFSSYWYRVKAIQGAGDSDFSNVAETRTDILPEPWRNQDIGEVAHGGESKFFYQAFECEGWGSDIGGRQDSFQFTYLPWSGDGEIISQTVSSFIAETAKYGLMFRESLNAGSPNASVLMSHATGVAFQARTGTGADTVVLPGDSSASSGWLKLSRHGHLFSAYYSSDATNWVLIGSQTVSMADSVFVGMAISACDNTSEYPASINWSKTVVRTPGQNGPAPPARFVSIQKQEGGPALLRVEGGLGHTYEIQGTTFDGSWQPLVQNSTIFGSGTAIDLYATGFSTRFYRAVAIW